MERIAIDVFGPLPETDNGKKYLLIAMDYFTKWPEAYLLPNQEATTVANVLIGEFFSRMGIPLEIHSNQGRNFESNVFQEICKLLHIKKTRTTPAPPVRWNGRVTKSYNRSSTGNICVRKPEGLGHLLATPCRSAVHDTTKCTPAELMFGRNFRLPIDLLYGQPEEEKHVEATEYVSQLQKFINMQEKRSRS